MKVFESSARIIKHNLGIFELSIVEEEAACLVPGNLTSLDQK